MIRSIELVLTESLLMIDVDLRGRSWPAVAEHTLRFHDPFFFSSSGPKRLAVAAV